MHFSRNLPQSSVDTTAAPPSLKYRVSVVDMTDPRSTDSKSNSADNIVRYLVEYNWAAGIDFSSLQSV